MPCQAPYVTGADVQGGGSGVGIDSLQAGLWVPAGAPGGAQTNFVLPTPNIVYAMRFVCPKALTISKIVFSVATLAAVNDPCDAGIYSADGAVLLGSAGSTLGKLNAALGPQTLTMQAPISLAKDTIYYAAWGIGTIGGAAAAIICTTMPYYMTTPFGAALGQAEQIGRSGAGNFPLSAPFGTFSTITNSVPIMALVT